MKSARHFLPSLFLAAMLFSASTSHPAFAESPAPAPDGAKSRLEYLVVDVSAGPDARSYPVTMLEKAPAEGWTDEYKTKKIVLRLVKPGSYEKNYAYFNSGLHRVTLSRPFYLGVFEVTQRQWELVSGARPFAFTNAACAATRPADTIGYADIRGRALGLAWPYSRIVDSDSFVGRLRSRTGMAGFDIPTDAQWEYACRAGETGACSNVAAMARIRPPDQKTSRQFSKSSPSAVGAEEGTAPVGSYPPNAWGFHDMLGNVAEWVRDHYNRLAAIPDGELVDPVGTVCQPSDNRCLFRGGDYRSRPIECGYDTISARGIGSEQGFRLCLEFPPDTFTAEPSAKP